MLSLDYNYISVVGTDSYRRLPIRIDWLKLINVANADAHTKMKAELRALIFKAAHNFQVLSLEHLINNTLSLTSDVEIYDKDWYFQVYVPNLNERYVEDVFTVNLAETGGKDIFLFGEEESAIWDDFVILIHPSDAGQASTILELAKSYVQGGKRYKTVTTL